LEPEVDSPNVGMAETLPAMTDQEALAFWRDKVEKSAKSAQHFDKLKRWAVLSYKYPTWEELPVDVLMSIVDQLKQASQNKTEGQGV
jgi:hypothetical protein